MPFPGKRRGPGPVEPNHGWKGGDLPSVAVNPGSGASFPGPFHPGEDSEGRPQCEKREGSVCFLRVAFL